MHGGTPSAAYEIPQVARAVTDKGWQLVTYSRPGYAGSTVQPGRTVADAAADVVAVLVHLGLDRFVTLGWSGGGPHALACAALLPVDAPPRPPLPASRRTARRVWTSWTEWGPRTTRSSVQRSISGCAHHVP